MTQDGLEQIFGQYIQTMEAFKPINLNDEEDDDDDDDEFHEVMTVEDMGATLEGIRLSTSDKQSKSSTASSLLYV